MKSKRLLTTVSLFVLAALLALLPAASPVTARGAAPASATVPYSGQLSDDLGQPVTDGAYAFRFALYDAAQDGRLLWSETQAGVALKEGAFAVQLGSAAPLPAEARITDGWLSVSVRGPAEMLFTALSPRQRLNTSAQAAPTSPLNGSTCPHTHFGEFWNNGVLEQSLNAGLHVRTIYAGQDGVYGTSVAGIGVFGDSESHIGVAGYGRDYIGVYGTSLTGIAMEADGNAKQIRPYGGWVKAMARVAGTSITRCFNSQVMTAADATTPPCGFSSTGAGGGWTVDFNFIVNDRFITVTPEWGSVGVPSAVVDSFPAADQVKIRLSESSAFYIIVY